MKGESCHARERNPDSQPHLIDAHVMPFKGPTRDKNLLDNLCQSAVGHKQDQKHEYLVPPQAVWVACQKNRKPEKKEQMPVVTVEYQHSGWRAQLDTLYRS